jgi:hypothetical protein
MDEDTLIQEVVVVVVDEDDDLADLAKLGKCQGFGVVKDR